MHHRIINFVEKHPNTSVNNMIIGLYTPPDYLHVDSTVIAEIKRCMLDLIEYGYLEYDSVRDLRLANKKFTGKFW